MRGIPWLSVTVGSQIGHLPYDFGAVPQHKEGIAHYESRTVGKARCGVPYPADGGGLPSMGINCMCWFGAVVLLTAWKVW